MQHDKNNLQKTPLAVAESMPPLPPATPSLGHLLAVHMCVVYNAPARMMKTTAKVDSQQQSFWKEQGGGAATRRMTAPSTQPAAAASPSKPQPQHAAVILDVCADYQLMPQHAPAPACRYIAACVC